jgi:hypothetical protein
MAKSKKQKSPMDKLTKGYEKFIEGKELNPKGEEVFNKTLKKASKPRGSK